MQLIVIDQISVPSSSEYSGWRHARNLGIGVLLILPEVSHPQQGWEGLFQRQPTDALSTRL